MKFLVFFIISIFTFSQAFASTRCRPGQIVSLNNETLGFVFYCKDDRESQRYLSKKDFESIFGANKVGLMAAPGDLHREMVRWSNVCGRRVEETRASIGSGPSNTRRIMAQEGHGRGESAADRCFSFYPSARQRQTIGQWFLPSRDELRLMYLVLKQRDIGNFINGPYWSSTESRNHNTTAVMLSFANGKPRKQYKCDRYNVRCIRAF